jgi:hypothetical protein
LEQCIFYLEYPAKSALYARFNQKATGFGGAPVASNQQSNKFNRKQAHYDKARDQLHR